tara:strand:+ start:2728 stop:3039 length:312 start_codon:yes stop_codon:yes gene_type:complete
MKICKTGKICFSTQIAALRKSLKLSKIREQELHNTSYKCECGLWHLTSNLRLYKKDIENQIKNLQRKEDKEKKVRNDLNVIRKDVSNNIDYEEDLIKQFNLHS